jgi:putative transposase
MACGLRINQAYRRRAGLSPELLIVLVHSASVQDAAGGYQVLQKLFATIKGSVHNRWCRLKLLWADAAYASMVEKVRKTFGWHVDIVRRSDQAKGLEVLPHRWIVKRTFGWLGRYRRLACDFEHTVSSSESVVYLASIRRMLKLATN